MSPAISFNLDQSKILSSGNELNKPGINVFEKIVGKEEHF